MDLGTDAFDATSTFALEDEAAGVSEVRSLAVLVLDTGNSVSTSTRTTGIFQTFTNERTSVTRIGHTGVGCRTSTELRTILGEERDVHGLVDTNTCNLHDALTGLQGITLGVAVDKVSARSGATDGLDQLVVLTWVEDGNAALGANTLLIKACSSIIEGCNEVVSIVSVRCVSSSTNTDLSSAWLNKASLADRGCLTCTTGQGAEDQTVILLSQSIADFTADLRTQIVV